MSSTQSMRGTSFGFGKRMDFCRSTSCKFEMQSPSPNSYNLKSNFDKISINQSPSKKSHNISFCFGTGRDAFNKVYLPGRKNIADPCVPGPGSYENIKVIAKDAKKFSLKSRIIYNDIEAIERKKGVPGPGYYINKLQIDKLGKYVVSDFQNNSNSKATRFNPSERFKYVNSKLKVPGPGAYEQIGTIDKRQQYASNFKTVAVRSFSKAIQRPDPKNEFQTPGPGTYRPPSDFGYVNFKFRQNESSVSSRLQSRRKMFQYDTIQNDKAEYSGQSPSQLNLTIESNIKRIRQKRSSMDDVTKSTL